MKNTILVHLYTFKIQVDITACLLKKTMFSNFCKEMILKQVGNIDKG